jgi:hypothetical protein
VPRAPRRRTRPPTTPEPGRATETRNPRNTETPRPVGREASTGRAVSSVPRCWMGGLGRGSGQKSGPPRFIGSQGVSAPGTHLAFPRIRAVLSRTALLASGDERKAGPAAWLGWPPARRGGSRCRGGGRHRVSGTGRTDGRSACRRRARGCPGMRDRPGRPRTRGVSGHAPPSPPAPGRKGGGAGGDATGPERPRPSGPGRNRARGRGRRDDPGSPWPREGPCATPCATGRPDVPVPCAASRAPPLISRDGGRSLCGSGSSPSPSVTISLR